MRLRAAAPTALVAALLVPASAAPAARVSVANFAYAPRTVQVAPGDTVTWSWAGPDTNHSVTADPGQAESFDSDAGVPIPLIDHPVGFTYSHTFTRPGSFTYFCQVHTFMRGRVDVVTSAADTTAPAITHLKARPARARRSVKLTFRLSESARVKLRIAAAKRPRTTLKSLTRSLRRGSRSLRVRVGSLRPGRYRATLVATDAAGNRSRAARVGFRVLGS